MHLISQHLVPHGDKTQGLWDCNYGRKGLHFSTELTYLVVKTRDLSQVMNWWEWDWEHLTYQECVQQRSYSCTVSSRIPSERVLLYLSEFYCIVVLSQERTWLVTLEGLLNLCFTTRGNSPITIWLRCTTTSYLLWFGWLLRTLHSKWYRLRVKL